MKSLTVIDGSAYFTPTNKPKKFKYFAKRDQLLLETPKSEALGSYKIPDFKDKSSLLKKFLQANHASVLSRGKLDTTPSPLESIKIQEKIERSLNKNRKLKSKSTAKMSLDNQLKAFSDKQGIDNLKLWIEHMKSQSADDELVYKAALKEIVRQVYLQSYDRGGLLKEATDTLNKIWRRKVTKYRKQLEDLKSNQIVNMREKNEEKIARLKDVIQSVTFM